MSVSWLLMSRKSRMARNGEKQMKRAFRNTVIHSGEEQGLHYWSPHLLSTLHACGCCALYESPIGLWKLPYKNNYYSHCMNNNSEAFVEKRTVQKKLFRLENRGVEVLSGDISSLMTCPHKNVTDASHPLSRSLLQPKTVINCAPAQGQSYCDLYCRWLNPWNVILI